ncbi:SMI1/KNR4 family protein [Lacticaseibacillus absianus]|uniref:SMI1/KNR4 family protein n=1 Tax=Lacticaseibacillus absianus TaxID=2729623 RepID=UPI0015C965CE|nr:SMI1/KNR4 family protein [Lacticaseibacillus absianus]
MHPWPNSIPPLPLPTLTPDPRIPSAYTALITTGQWPHTWFLPTTEPTSWAPDGAAIHAFLAPGEGPVAAPVTPDLVPFACDDAQLFCFDFTTTPPSIRYIDQDVDQWLTVAPSFEALLAQLTWRAPTLAEPITAQQRAHAMLVADGASLPTLFATLREDWPADWAAWLPVLATAPEADRRAAAQEEAAFVRRFMAHRLTPAQHAALVRFDQAR